MSLIYFKTNFKSYFLIPLFVKIGCANTNVMFLLNCKSIRLAKIFLFILVIISTSTFAHGNLISNSSSSTSSGDFSPALVNSTTVLMHYKNLTFLDDPASASENRSIFRPNSNLLEGHRGRFHRRRKKRQRHNNHHHLHHHHLHHGSSSSHHNSNNNNNNDLSLWIDETQVRMFGGNNNNGFPMEIQAITDGHVLPYILDPNFENYLPVIPSEVGVVNFTWKAGDKKYFYNFDRLQSFDEDILLPPIVSIETRGKIPKRPKTFSVFLPCSGLKSGIASFTVGLLIETRKGKPLNGTPLRLKLRKECFERSPDTECNKKCGNGGWCNNEKTCQCKEGYMGRYCETALCYPQCMNGGTCIEPGKCSCLNGFHGQFCEGGICQDKCLNNGKCIQKDTCECTKGYYGLRCEYSKCMIPCLNGGRCRGVNTCRCPSAYSGDHCEIELTTSPNRVSASKTANTLMTSITSEELAQNTLCGNCINGACSQSNGGRCNCFEGWIGKRCQKRSTSMLRGNRAQTMQ